MIKAYFFDWMGTMGNVDEENFVRTLLTKEQHHDLLVKNLNETTIPESLKIIIYNYLMNATTLIYPDSESTTRILKGIDYKLAIVSNMYDITATRIRKLYKTFLNNFDVITLSAEVGLRKPDPKMFNYTLDELNKIYHSDILPDEVIMIGDKQDKDIEPAEKLGMQTRLIDRTKGQTLIDFI